MGVVFVFIDGDRMNGGVGTALLHREEVAGRAGARGGAAAGRALLSYAIQVGAGPGGAGPRPVSGRCPRGGEAWAAEPPWRSTSAVLGRGRSSRSGFCGGRRGERREVRSVPGGRDKPVKVKRGSCPVGGESRCFTGRRGRDHSELLFAGPSSNPADLTGACTQVLGCVD